MQGFDDLLELVLARLDRPTARQGGLDEDLCRQVTAVLDRLRAHCRIIDLPNVGPVIAGVLRSLGCATPADLIGCDAIDLYQRLCRQRGGRQDPCVLDVFLSIERFLAGEEPRPWWAYSQERRRRFPNL